MKSKTKYLANSKRFQEKSLLWLCENFTYVFAFRGNGYANGFDSTFYASNSLSDYKTLQDLREIKPNKNTCLALSYDLKNEIEKLKSTHKSPFDFPNVIALESIVTLSFSNIKVKIESNYKKPEDLMDAIDSFKFSERSFLNPDFKSSTSKNGYIENIESIREHIVNGDIYEMCYCMEFLSKEYDLHSPASLFNTLCSNSPKPFASFLKCGSNFLVGASPERFLKAENQSIYSQPIKGTIARSDDFMEDNSLKEQLSKSEKDRSENLMIVDLVRNDLAKICTTGSIKVEDLFGVYSYPGVHQMISTVKGMLKSEVNFVDIVEASFPMGSMTGAPKIKAMELIDTFENFKRGMYSGTLGYFTQNGFDFNVTIRSLQYNSVSKTIGYHVGSAITFESDSEKEYDECLLKAKNLLELFIS